MKSFKFILLPLFIIIFILLAGCDFKLYNNPEVDEGAWREDFIALMNIDGSGVELIQSQHQNYFTGSRPYFVKDLAGNYDDEVILLDFANRIDIMSLDGEYRRTIIDSLGGVQYFNQDRTKMILLLDYKIYLCSVDGSEVEKISIDSVSQCFAPSFSFDENSILYNYSIKFDNTTVETGIVEYIVDTNESLVLLESPVQRDSILVTTYASPAKTSDEIIVYSYGTHINDNNVLTMMKSDYRMYNINTNEIRIIRERFILAKYSHSKRDLVYIGEQLLNLETFYSFYINSSISDIDDISFSSDDRYLMLNEIIYDTQADSTFILENGEFFGKYHNVSKTHMNLNNTKIVGIVGFLHY